MAKGVEVEITDGIAEIAFVDPSKRGPALSKLIEIGGPDAVHADTGGTRRTYITAESFAVKAGLVDKRRAPRRSGTKDTGGADSGKEPGDDTPSDTPDGAETDDTGSGDSPDGSDPNDS